MNTEDLEKLYKETMNDAAPDFWNSIESRLKPRAELSEEEKNAFEGPETVGENSAEAAAPASEVIKGKPEPAKEKHENAGQKPDNSERKTKTAGKKKAVIFHRPDRISAAGWVAAAAIIAVCIPAAMFFARQVRSRRYTLAEAAAAEEQAEDAMTFTMAAAEVREPDAEAPEAIPEIEGPAAEIVPDGAKEQPAMTMAAAALPEEEATFAAEAALPAGGNSGPGGIGGIGGTDDDSAHAASGNANTQKTAVRLLSVPDRAVTAPADAEYFTEEVLADTDMLTVFTVTRAEFVFDPNGHAYRLRYYGTVNESLLEDDESGRPGSELQILSPIVGSDTPDSTVLYQLVPGQVYILPLKKEHGDWYLVYPYAPQIRLHADGSFEFHTGYSSLLNDDTEAIPGSPMSKDDFWFDRIVVRSDGEFARELTELVEFRKKEKETP